MTFLGLCFKPPIHSDSSRRVPAIFQHACTNSEALACSLDTSHLLKNLYGQSTNNLCHKTDFVWMKCQPELNGKCTPFLHCISSFEVVLLIKIYNLQLTSSSISCFTITLGYLLLGGQQISFFANFPVSFRTSFSIIWERIPWQKYKKRVRRNQVILIFANILRSKQNEKIPHTLL